MFAIFPAPYVAAGGVTITHEDADGSGSNLQIYTFSSMSLGAESSDRQIIVLVGARDASTPRDITSVTVAGVTATEVVEAKNTDGSNTTIAAIYIVDLPTGTTGDVVISFNSVFLACGVSVLSMTGASATASTTATDNAGNPLDGSLNVPANGGAVGVCYHANGVSVTWTGLDEDVDTLTESPQGTSTAHINSAAGAMPLTVEALFSGSPIVHALATASFGPT